MGKGKRNRNRGKRYVFDKREGRMIENLSGKRISTPSTPQFTRANVATNFKLIIPDLVYRKIMHWINKANFEVSGFGSLDYNESENEFTVRDVILLRQEVGPGSAEIDANAMNKAMFDMREEPNALKWHWHSHVNMGVFWSADDMEIIRSLGQQGWIFATVFNKREEKKSAFLTTTQVLGRPHDIFVDDIPTSVQVPVLDAEEVAVLDAQYDALVKSPANRPYQPPLVASSQSRGSGSHHRLIDDGAPFPFGDPYGDFPPLGHRSEKRWAPTSFDGPKPEDYDDTGYAKYEGDFFYNPIYDKQVTEDGLFLVIDAMHWPEIQLCREICPKFAKALEGYFAWKASRPNVPLMEGNDPDPEEKEKHEMDQIDFMGGGL